MPQVFPERKGMSEQELIKLMILSSIPVRHLDDNNRPDAHASGTIVNYRGKNFFLTVTHVVEEENWVFEYRFDFSRNGMIVQPLPNINFIVLRGNISVPFKIEEVDFAWIAINPELQPYYPVADSNFKIIGEVPRIINNIDECIRIEKVKKYGFASMTCNDLIGSNLNEFQQTVFPMEYLYDEDGFKVFGFEPKQTEEFYFEASSGAPIIDSEGKLVGLISGGKLSEKLIYGVSIEEYKELLK